MLQDTPVADEIKQSLRGFFAYDFLKRINYWQ